jgi:hypothetical protein
MSKYWSLLVFSALFMSTVSGIYAQDIQMWSSSFVEMQIKSKSTASLEKELSALKTEQLIAKLATDQEKKSFWINIYNGFIIKKIRANPESYQKRSSFFSKRDISIAGQLFSFDDIEHVILRKQQWKYGLGFVNKPFVSKLFEALSVNKLDSRIHFALNCGAKSCPPTRVYQLARIEEQLNTAQRHFIENTSIIGDNKVELSRLFLWYKGDFESKSAILRLVQQNSSEDLKSEQIKYSPYYWDIDLNNYILD